MYNHGVRGGCGAKFLQADVAFKCAGSDQLHPVASLYPEDFFNSTVVVRKTLTFSDPDCIALSSLTVLPVYLLVYWNQGTGGGVVIDAPPLFQQASSIWFTGEQSNSWLPASFGFGMASTWSPIVGFRSDATIYVRTQPLYCF